MIIGRNRPGWPATQAIEGSNNVTTFSDAELAELIQAYLDGGGNISNLRFDNKGEAHAIHVYAVTGEIYSPEAEAVFENMPTEPTTPQKQAIAAFVDSLVAVDIWSKIDHFNFMGSGLSWPENNALTDWIAGRTAIKNGTPTLGLDGYDFNGVDQWLDSSYNPSTDATGYQLNDALAGAYLTEAISNRAFGGRTSVPTAVEIWQNAGTDVRGVLNISGPATILNRPIKAEFLVIDRKTNIQAIYTDGTSEGTLNEASVAVPNQNIAIAARLNDGTPEAFSTGKITTFLAGGSLTDPEHVTLYNSVIQLLIDFDVFAGPVLAKFATLTTAEQTAVRNFVNAEVLSGNWFLYQSFRCFAFTNEADALTDLKDDSIATNNGAVHIAGIGFEFNGVDQNIKGQLIDFTGTYARLNMMHGAYVVSHDLQNDAGNHDLYGFGANRNRFFIQEANNRKQFHLDSGSSIPFDEGNSQIQSGELLTFARVSNFDNRAYRNGSQILSNGQTAVTGAGGTLTYGSRDQNDSYWKGRLGTVVVGAGIGFDHVAHTNNVNLLLQDLEVQRVLNRFATLTASEQTAVEDYIRADWKNYKLMDELFIFAFTNEADCLTGFKSKTATNNGATFDGTGAVLASTSNYINTNYDPSADAVNYKQNDANISVFSKSFDRTVTGRFQMLFGGGANFYICNTFDLSTKSEYIVNGQADPAQDEIQDSTLYASARTSSSDCALFRNGVSIDSNNTASVPIVSSPALVGGFQVGNVLGMRGTVSTAMIGAAIGFDHGGHNINIRELLTKLGAI